ncbi:carbohydrate ABC transporter permease [Paenibacillus radicis (ex Xue et al. 2023)]|uniref:Carbohydrate ABC transporter permease n=1 Tax=Paenibacillus radicis (ex Xue et al. 2023) TaxID=2972489 RepID=A0ABT1YVD9_9BACL|nr:carbohydrate ABC transporter permease [Paenibacillus radicis (ex Xue et al. 2023)]MCR8636906.1 carbohydrate ABC transporter permease [Paenibacillus radicis (ex Xue et al. 2023)]
MAMTKRKDKVFNSVMYLIMVVASLIVLVPTLWMVSTAFKPNDEVMVTPPQWIPDAPTWESFIRIWNDYPFATYFANSVYIVLAATIISLVFSAMAGYGASRFRFRGKSAFLTFLLVTQMFPSIMLLIPFYKVLKTLGLIDTHMGLILVYISFTIPFCTWMMMGFFQGIPKELDEAATIDGCGRIRTFVQIILPLSLPGIAATAIYSFLQGWNEYMFALILTTSEEMKTLPVGIGQLNGFYKIVWNDMMAASFVSSLPLVILFLFLQKYFISSLTAGAVKQ